MIYSFLYVLIFSLALVLIQKLDLNIPPLFSLLITATIACIYFNYINRKHLKKMYLHCLSNRLDWLSIMIIVLIMWATTMIGPGKIGASFFNFIYFAWLGMMGFMSMYLQQKQKSKINLNFSLLLLSLIITNVLFELKSSFNSDTIIGISLAILGGTSSFIYFKRSQALAKCAELSATQILAVRFHLSIIVLALFLPKYQLASSLNVIDFINLIFLAIFSLIIPLYFSQKALEKITSEQHAVINSLCPVMTAIIQKITFNDIKYEQMIIYVLYSLVILSFYVIRKYSNTEIIK